MTGLMQTKSALESITSEWIDDVYVNVIPPEELDKVDKTIALIKPVYDTLDDFGTNTFNSITQLFIIQIFYANGSDFDYDLKEISVYKGLESKGFRINLIKGRLVDPDSLQDYQTFQVTLNKTV